jgi:hypothetical protein
VAADHQAHGGNMADPAAAHIPAHADDSGAQPADNQHPGVFPEPEPAPEPERSRGSRPTLRRLAGLSGWAALLGLLGMAVGIRGLVAVIATTPPGWYQPTLILIGIAGIITTAAAFVTARRGLTPWILLGTASAVLITSLVITSVALD